MRRVLPGAILWILWTLLAGGLVSNWTCVLVSGIADSCFGTGHGADQYPVKAKLSFHRWLWRRSAGQSADLVNGTTPVSGLGGVGEGGRFILGGILSLTEKDSDQVCQHVWSSTKSTAVVFVEAFQLAAKWVMDEIVEKDPSFADVVAGVEIHDSCHAGKVSLESAINMVNRPEVGSVEAGEACRQDVPIVVGPSISSELLVTTSSLSTYQVPHITYWATSDRFVSKHDYPYLFRTVSSDQYQAEAMADVLKAFNWTFVSVLGSSDAYGRPGIQALNTAIANGQSACIFSSDEFSVFDTNRTASLLKNIISDFPHNSSNNKPSVIAVICGPSFAGSLFRTLENLALSEDASNEAFRNKLRNGSFVWLASDGWVSSVRDFNVFHSKNRHLFGNHSVIGFEQMIPHSFSKTHSKFLRHLSRHLQQLTASKEAVARNPWIVPVIENAVGCSFNASSECTSDVCSIPCDENMSVSSAVGIDIDHLPTPLSTGSLWLAIRAALFAIWEVHRTSAGAPFAMDRKRFRSKLLGKIDCDLGHNACKVFEDNQDIAPGYKVLALRTESEGHISVRNVAQWHSYGQSRFRCDGTGSDDLSSCATFAGLDNLPPPSRCSEPCKKGQYLELSLWSAGRLGSCCWHCRPCPGRSVNNGSSHECTECSDLYTEANADKSACVEKPSKLYAPPSSQIALWPCSIAGVCSVIVLYTLLRLADFSAIEKFLNFIILLCLVLCLAVTYFVVLAPPSCLSCSLNFILVPFVFVNPIILLVVRCLHLVQCSKHKDGIPRLILRMSSGLGTSAGRYSLLCLLCCLPTLIIHVAWLLMDRQCEKKLLLPTSGSLADGSVYLVCEDDVIMQSVSFLVVLLVSILALIVAVASRKAIPPRDMGSATRFDPNFITSAQLAQTILLIVIAPSQFLISPVLHPTLFAAGLILQVAVLWLCIFMPRLYRSYTNRQLTSSLSATSARFGFFRSNSGKLKMAERSMSGNAFLPNGHPSPEHINPPVLTSNGHALPTPWPSRQTRHVRWESSV